MAIPRGHPALILSLTLLLLLSQFPPCLSTTFSQVPGTYQLLETETPSLCPSTVTIPSPSAVAKTPISTISHKSISTTSRCSSSSSLPLIPASAYEKRTTKTPDTSVALVEALLRTDAIFGVEPDDRVCGNATLRAGAFVAFVNSRDDPDFMGASAALEEGKTLMLVAESGVEDPARCLYASKTVQEDSSSGSCFPASANFHLDSPAAPEIAARASARNVAATTKADALRHATRLSTGRVLFFTHRDARPDVLHRYLRITTTLNASIAVSPDHYLLTPTRSLVAAAAVAPGARLLASGGSGSDRGVHVVSRVDVVWLSGKVNPHTETGVVDVDGFRVSCYTREVHPWLAHAAVRLAAVAESFVGERVVAWGRMALSTPEEGVVRAVRTFLPGGPETVRAVSF